MATSRPCVRVQGPEEGYMGDWFFAWAGMLCCLETVSVSVQEVYILDNTECISMHPCTGLKKPGFYVGGRDVGPFLNRRGQGQSCVNIIKGFLIDLIFPWTVLSSFEVVRPLKTLDQTRQT